MPPIAIRIQPMISPHIISYFWKVSGMFRPWNRLATLSSISTRSVLQFSWKGLRCYPRDTSLKAGRFTMSSLDRSLWDNVTLQSWRSHVSVVNEVFKSPSVDKVCIVGSGNWGSAIARILGRNCESLPYFHPTVRMWVYQEMIPVSNGRSMKLSDYINTYHENIKYLPGAKLPLNVIAHEQLEEACEDASLLVFALPHQFLSDLLPTIRATVPSHCRGVSLIKGLGIIRTIFELARENTHTHSSFFMYLYRVRSSNKSPRSNFTIHF